MLFTDVINQTSTEDSTEKVVLEFNQIVIKSLKDLRKCFDKEECLSALKDGRLYRWLSQYYYEKEAEEIHALNFEDANCLQKMTKILGINYATSNLLTPEELAAYNAKKEEVQKYTSNEKILADVNIVAMNQEELAELLNAEEKQIYLCNESFTIPISVSGVTYTGLGTIEIENPFTAEQYEKAGIKIENITLPTAVNPDTEHQAKTAAKENGYDDFAESHCDLATAFHNLVKANYFGTYYSLPQKSSLASKFFTSKSECESAKKDALEKAYDTANQYLSAGTSKSFASEAAKFYTKVLSDRCLPITNELQTLCRVLKKETLGNQILTKIKDCKKELMKLFEQELYDSFDYYEMYQFDYFLDQVEVEEYDYRISEDLFTQLLETLLTDSLQYTITDLPIAIMEMESDLNDRANTFFKAAHTEYVNYVKSMEDLFEKIGANLAEMNDKESIEDYLSRMSVAQQVSA